MDKHNFSTRESLNWAFFLIKIVCFGMVCQFSDVLCTFKYEAELLILNCELEFGRHE